MKSMESGLDIHKNGPAGSNDKPNEGAIMRLASGCAERCECGLIDVHSHYLPPCYAHALSDAGLITLDGGFPVPSWSEAGAIAHMDKHNIDTSILSISSPSVGFLNDAPARQRLAREVNVFAADLTQRNPQRFGVFGTLPLPDIQSSLAEIAYALDHLRLDGVVMETNVHGIYLGDQRLDPIFSELNRRKATLFLHPTSPACFEAVGLGRPAPILEFPMDTARTVTDLIFAGTLTRYPDIRMIIPHAGGALTAVADRIASFSSLPFLAQRPAGGAAEVRKVLASLYYDLAGSARDSMIDGLRHLTSLTHILFGSDYPFTPEEGINANVEAFRTLSSLKNVEHEAIARKNALALFPRLRAI
ncbi:amidohydrolase family protein [Glaciimonas sp. CA11.2]|uniref:amidohydrolase family protein n=1 Tax=Glaciimonas sp. CA11.2 TaxID=3048601 RepID=UPI002AB3B012|nr:amidohydrolase family protein [Glaciimonas sp. CA11.2]MDY7544646.1 amidohydrolase family protein [Glaciimonas sp. CA11.2]MEB0163716.1 amidohydrolase family protein [Glaciimonas sp. CA11.2]